MAIKRGGGRPVHLFFILFCCYLKIFDYISKNQYWQCWQSRGLLTGLLQYLAKNMALLVQKLWTENFHSPFSAILRLKKKVPIAASLRLERKKKKNNGKFQCQKYFG